MNPDDQDHSARRPPAGPARWATVTRLGPGSSAARPAPIAPVDGALALQGQGPARPGPGAPLTPELRLVADRSREPSGGPAPGPRPGGDDLQTWAARFAQGVVEVLGGDRPLTQLVRWTSRRVYVDLDRRVRLLTRLSGTDRRHGMIRPQVRSVHVCRPTDGVAEVSVHVRHGHRSRAMAARLELVRGRWQCTALQLG